MEQIPPSDEDLVRLCLQGDRNGLSQLVDRYKRLIYNLAFKMTLQDADAADITQEVLIKVITKLAGFRQESSFKTWVYRIAVNHILNFRKSEAVRRRTTFRQYGQTLDNAPDAELPASKSYEADREVLYEETKQTCMSGMLLCLDKRHRIVFLLGELFGVNDKTGSQVMDITPENFRMMLSRARRDLYHFMNDKCGLVNTANPCRCARKTKAFIDAGFVDPKHLRFARAHLHRMETIAGERQRELDDWLENEYRKLYLGHSLPEGSDLVAMINELLASDTVNRIFNFK